VKNELIRLEELFEKIKECADHQIPFYAYGDNEAACRMSDYLEKIWDMAHRGLIILSEEVEGE